VYTVIDLTQTLSDDSLSYPGTVPAWTAQQLKIDSPKATVTRFSAFDLNVASCVDSRPRPDKARGGGVQWRQVAGCSPSESWERRARRGHERSP